MGRARRGPAGRGRCGRVSLRFFLGAAGAGKTRACLDEICDELVKDPLSGKPLYFLVPEQATFQMERALLFRTGRT